MNFLWRLLSRLLLSWPPACKAVGKKAERCRKGGEGRALWPAEPDTHSVPTFCFILLTALCLPVLEKAREDECALGHIQLFQNQSALWLWIHHLREPHDSEPSRWALLSQPARLLRNTTKPTIRFHYGFAFRMCRFTYSTAKPITANKTKPKQIWRIHQPTKIHTMHLWIFFNVYWVRGITVHLQNTTMNRTSTFF